MKLSWPKLIVVFILTLLALAVAFPTIYFKAGDQYKRIRGLDPKDLNPNFLLQEFSLKPALDLQGGTELTFNVDMSSLSPSLRKQQFEQIRDIIYARLSRIGLTDFELTTSVNDQDKDKSQYFINLRVAEPIDQNLLSLLVSRGEVSVWVKDLATTEDKEETEEDQNNPFNGRIRTGITNADIAAVYVVSDSRIFFSDPNQPNNYGLHVNFAPESESKFVNALYANTTGTVPMLFAIDESPVAVQAQGQLFNGVRPGRDLLLYTFVGDTAYANAVLGAVMGTPVINFPVQIQRTASIEPLLGLDTLPQLKVALLITFVLAQALTIYYFRRRGVFAVVSSSVFLIWSIALIKMFGTALSLTMVLGFLAGLAMFILFMVLITYQVRTISKGGLTKDELLEIYNYNSKNFYGFAIATLIICLVIQYYATVTIQQFAVGIGFTSISGIIVMAIAVKQLMPLIFLHKTK